MKDIFDKNYTKRLIGFAFILVLLLPGCSSMVQKGGELLEGNAFNEMELARYSTNGKRGDIKVELRELRQEDGNVVMDITSSEWPGLTLRGGQANGSGVFELFRAHILSSHTQGWNEFDLDILGKAVFYNPMKSGGVLDIQGETERIQITSGKIRLKSSRITGNEALSRLRNRRERILALTEWMEDQTVSMDTSQVRASQKEFENYWKPRLFPELVSKKNRPPEYRTENASWVRADSVKWNSSYTKTIFPEEAPGAAQLWEYRDSGALLRDWEEALPWIYMEYAWDHIIASFNNINLQKNK